MTVALVMTTLYDHIGYCWKSPVRVQSDSHGRPRLFLGRLAFVLLHSVPWHCREASLEQALGFAFSLSLGMRAAPARTQRSSSLTSLDLRTPPQFDVTQVEQVSRRFSHGSISGRGLCAPRVLRSSPERATHIHAT